MGFGYSTDRAARSDSSETAGMRSTADRSGAESIGLQWPTRFRSPSGRFRNAAVVPTAAVPERRPAGCGRLFAFEASRQRSFATEVISMARARPEQPSEHHDQSGRNRIVTCLSAQTSRERLVSARQTSTPDPQWTFNVQVRWRPCAAWVSVCNAQAGRA